MSQGHPAIVIGVPGKWQDRSDIVTSIAKHSGGYLFAGAIFMNTETQRGFGLEVYGHDPEMAAKIKSSGLGRISDEDIAEIEDHTHTLYLTSSETGLAVVREIMDAVCALLRSGGMAVKVEFAGLSVSAADWIEATKLKAGFPLCRAWTTFVGEGNDHVTCGMRAFSLPDCHIVGPALDVAFKTAIEFCNYLITESPKITDGHTFSINEDAERYRVSFDNYSLYPPDDDFHNPNGEWILTPVASQQVTDES